MGRRPRGRRPARTGRARVLPLHRRRTQTLASRACRPARRDTCPRRIRCAQIADYPAAGRVHRPQSLQDAWHILGKQSAPPHHVGFAVVGFVVICAANDGNSACHGPSMLLSTARLATDRREEDSSHLAFPSAPDEDLSAGGRLRDRRTVDGDDRSSNRRQSLYSTAHAAIRRR
jgi:hypothetical protein